MGPMFCRKLLCCMTYVAHLQSHNMHQQAYRQAMQGVTKRSYLSNALFLEARFITVQNSVAMLH